MPLLRTIVVTIEAPDHATLVAAMEEFARSILTSEVDSLGDTEESTHSRAGYHIIAKWVTKEV